ncbi:MAG: AzlD domain-containing protein [Anaerolineales bacterium]
MPPELVWAIIFGGMVVTYITRLSFIALIPVDRLPTTVRHALGYAPPAVLAAIIGPELLVDGGTLVLWPNARLLAGLGAMLVAWRTKNTWLTIAIGMLGLWLLGALGLPLQH